MKKVYSQYFKSSMSRNEFIVSTPPPPPNQTLLLLSLSATGSVSCPSQSQASSWIYSPSHYPHPNDHHAMSAIRPVHCCLSSLQLLILQVRPLSSFTWIAAKSASWFYLLPSILPSSQQVLLKQKLDHVTFFLTSLQQS